MISERDILLLDRNQRIQVTAGSIKAEGTLDKKYKKAGCLKIDDGSKGWIFPLTSITDILKI
jgi:hypothetical protein